MNTATTLLRMLSSGRVQPAPDEIDPAEMGTCFGLEMSLDDPAAAAPAKPAAVAPRRAEAWWQRLGSRRPASA